MHDAYGILVIEASDWDAEQLRGLLRTLSKPIRVLKSADLDEENTRVDVIILGFSDAVSLETSRATLERARAQSPNAQLILCVPREIRRPRPPRAPSSKARAFLSKPIEEATFRALMEQTLGSIHLRRERQEHARAIQALRPRRRNRRHELPSSDASSS